MSDNKPGAFFRDPARVSRVNRKVDEKWRGIWAAIVILIPVAVGTSALLNGLMDWAGSASIEVVAPAYVVAIIFAGLTGGCIYGVREIARWKYYGYFESAVGMGAASLFIRPGEVPLTRLLIFAVGISVVVDGIKRVRESSRPQRTES